MEITFHPLTRSNLKEALEFWSNIPGIYLHENGEDSEQGLAAYLERNPGLSFLARYNGKIIGTVLCGHDGRRAFINHLAVEQSFQRRGIGKKLIEMPLDELRRIGITKCALFVLKDNDTGNAFYKSQNWQEENAVNTFSKML